MRVLTGDECGVLKETITTYRPKQDPIHKHDLDVKSNSHLVDPSSSLSRSRGIIDLQSTTPSSFWSDGAEKSDELSFAALRANGSVEFWNASAPSSSKQKNNAMKYELLHSNANIFDNNDNEDTLKQKPLGMGAISKDRMCIVDSLANVSVVHNTNGEIVKQFNAYAANKKKGEATISYTKGQHQNNQIATAMTVNPLHSVVAVGGRERETTMVDLETGQVVFKAKNLPPDPQTLLQQPVWPSAITYMDDKYNTLAVGTAFKELRIYDVREDSKVRRPTAASGEDLLEYRVTALAAVDSNRLAVGDSGGFMYDVDLRVLNQYRQGKTKKMLSRYLGGAGSIRQIRKHPTQPRLVAVGLDRMMRIYDTNNRRELSATYLKQRLNCALVCDMAWDKTASGSTKRTVSDDDSEQDEEEYDSDMAMDQEDVVKEMNYSDDDSASGSENEESGSGSEEEEEEEEDESSSGSDDEIKEEESDEDDEDEDESDNDDESPRRASKKRRSDY